MDESGFAADRKTQLAVIRAFEVTGEIVKRIPDPVLSLRPDIDWRAIKGFRDILIHQYDNVDLAIVWDAVSRVPPLKEAVQSMLKGLSQEE